MTCFVEINILRTNVINMSLILIKLLRQTNPKKIPTFHKSVQPFHTSTDT